MPGLKAGHVKSPGCLVSILHMRELGHLVPFDRVAGAVGAEHRIGGIVQIRLRIIVRLSHHPLLVMAWTVSGERATQSPATVRV